MLFFRLALAWLTIYSAWLRVEDVQAASECYLEVYPAVPICPKSAPICVSGDDHQFALQWLYDTDMDDLADLWEDGKMPVSYRLINTLLISLRYKDESALRWFNELQKSLQEYSGKDDAVIRNTLIDNIAHLHSTLHTYPIAATVGVTRSIKLYHGEKFVPMLKELAGLAAGDAFRLPAFMSTSFVEDVACRFTSTQNPAILEITVPREKLQRFRYTYMGEEIDLDGETTIKDTEVLLNMDTVLTFQSMELRPSVSFSKYSVQGGQIWVVPDQLLGVTVFHLTFKSSPEHTSRNLQAVLRRQADALFNGAVHPRHRIREQTPPQEVEPTPMDMD